MMCKSKQFFRDTEYFIYQKRTLFLQEKYTQIKIIRMHNKQNTQYDQNCQLQFHGYMETEIALLDSNLDGIKR
ncbi:unnamed protein product [Paramecium primaurelia]|uniref:Uncharacterized protein n=1 Tax=Paramecium primaurelia TaxID=5886 RepID=A0A8S1K4F8_PARPR|nr:unnamed protein product [Paramecium primaurelia]